MLRKLLDNKARLLSAIFLVLLLALVRAFESDLFYDPFSDYFKGDYFNLAFPAFETEALFCAMTFRYFLNSIISFGMIYVLFADIGLLKFTGVLYLILYVILIAAFFSLLYFSDSSNNFMLFYVRRFLIQPLFLLLFVPAFYYQRLTKK